MNILSYPYYYARHSGGEVYLHNLLKGLQSLGHNVKVCALGIEDYIYEGIEVYGHSGGERVYLEGNEQCEWADVIFTQLIGLAHGISKSVQHNKPTVFFAHNTSKHYAIRDSKVVYNSHFLSDLNLFPNNESTILQPLVYLAEQSHGSKIALINCNQNKGGYEFIELAEMLPQYEFIGYKGSYGEQYIGQLPNLKYYENGVIDWSEIGILLVPSEFESWSQVASEAICRGIPVICSDIVSLRENLSYAGIYLHRSNLSEWAKMIDYLMWNKDKQVELCLRMAKEYEPEKRLKEFNDWLCQVIK